MAEKSIFLPLFLCRLAWFHCGKACAGCALLLKRTSPQPSELAYKHTVALSAFMFIQIFESGTSQQKYSVWKIQYVRYNQQQKAFCACDGGVCLWILSKHKGMMGELQSSPCPITLCLAASWIIINTFITVLVSALYCICLYTEFIKLFTRQGYLCVLYLVPLIFISYFFFHSVSLWELWLLFFSSCGKCQIYWADWTAGHVRNWMAISKHCSLSLHHWFTPHSVSYQVCVCLCLFCLYLGTYMCYNYY